MLNGEDFVERGRFAGMAAAACPPANRRPFEDPRADSLPASRAGLGRHSSHGEQGDCSARGGARTAATVVLCAAMLSGAAPAAAVAAAWWLVDNAPAAALILMAAAFPLLKRMLDEIWGCN